MTRISGRVIAAGRALVGVSLADFATACGIDVDTLCRLEAGGMGAGVRLKFTRTDVRQIARLESEGGVVGSDDAP